MLDALAPSQVDEVISLLDRLAEATKRRAAEKIALSPDEVIADPQRWQLTDYLYALNDERRGELIALMLVGRGDVQDCYERAVETRYKHTSADDQVSYLMGKTVRLAEYLKIGLETALQKSASALESPAC